MKKYVMALLAASSLLGATASYAQPGPPYPKTLSGFANVQKDSGPVLLCAISVTFYDASPPPGAVTATVWIGPGDPRCASIQVNPGPYPVRTGPGGAPSFTIDDIFVDTTITAGDCKGSISGTWNPATLEWDIDDILPEVDPGTGDCTVVGAVS